MNTKMPLHLVTFRLAAASDAARLQDIRRQAFAPVFASFRALLGDEVYGLVNARADEEQAALLTSLLAGARGTSVYVATAGDDDERIVGFVTVIVTAETGIGEIGLNAVDPAHAGQGVGTSMYRFALDVLREAGMRAATVSTGGDPSHAAARRAYEKVGFTAGIPSVWLAQAL